MTPFASAPLINQKRSGIATDSVDPGKCRSLKSQHRFYSYGGVGSGRRHGPPTRGGNNLPIVDFFDDGDDSAKRLTGDDYVISGYESHKRPPNSSAKPSPTESILAVALETEFASSVFPITEHGGCCS